MKTRMTALFAAGLMAMALFAGCTPGTDSPNPTDLPTVTATPTDAVITPQPTDAIAPDTLEPGGIAVEGVTFDESMQSFFGGDAEGAIQKMAPLLVSAASARGDLGKDFFAEGQNGADPEFEWNVIYLLLNGFGENDADITMDGNGELSVPAARMEAYFASAFASFKTPVPALIENFSITYDEASGAYAVARSDAGDAAYVVKGLTLSNASSAEDPSSSAMLVIGVKDAATGEITGTVNVEVVENAASAYGYSIQSVTVEAE